MPCARSGRAWRGGVRCCSRWRFSAAEYSEKIGHDITPVTNNFYMFYFMLTGIHFMHVLLGLGVLVFLWLRSRRASITPGDIVLFESGATFWHMVDLLWIVLFPLLYLMK